MNNQIKYLTVVGLSGTIIGLSFTLTVMIAPKYMITNKTSRPQVPTQVSHFENQIEVEDNMATSPATISQQINIDKKQTSTHPAETSLPSPIPSPQLQTNPLMQSITSYFGCSESAITINYQTSNHAQGQFGQKWWLAVNGNSGWRIIASGTSYINCSDISGYNFPTHMAPACWDYATNQLINR